MAEHLLHQQQQQPCARLCHIVKWDDFDGYGFNLHAEKGKSGQFIGKVDEGSPSEAAGLRQGDRIVEVNEINIANESHKQVVERIKAFPAETKLLVVDQPADDFFKASNVLIKGSMPGVRVLKTPERSPASVLRDEQEAAAALAEAHRDSSLGNGHNQMTSDTHSIGSSNEGRSQVHHENGNGSTVTRLDDDYPDTASNKSSSSAGAGNSAGNSAGPGAHKDGPGSNGNATTGSSSSGGSLNLTMSAKELRARLAQRKKYDPKKESMGFKDKFDIVQKL